MNSDTKTKNILLYVFLSIYVITAIGTLSMLFLGIGAVRDGERALLINTFLIESALAIGALFYSLWGLKKNENEALDRTRGLIVNPLEESFKDLVIPVEALRLPRRQIQENKHFKRCKFIGPATIAFMGTNLRDTGFVECGDIIPVPNGAFITGVLVLKNCTIEDCEFIKVTLLLSEADAKNMAQQIPGIKVAGT